MNKIVEQIKKWAKELKKEVLTLWFCQKHLDIPLLAKVLSILVVAYAFSPIDLIPDFIPVLGFLDDIIIVPIGIYFVLKLIPEHVINESREKANQWIEENNTKPKNWFVAAIIMVIWLLLLAWIYLFFMKK
ncbi:YkvA family protein [Acinetobacter seifertii]|jgi:uncharacterized membrane protein YkvA (DUF1232 family)|uniref:YkvA family protein n=1 Tax=Acinetobacter seifertii TaxID=1530123 RepID=UPI00386223A5